jgi:hypothetical protein
MRSFKSFAYLSAGLALSVVCAGVVDAAEITSVSVAPSAVTINKSASGSFSVSVDSISGSVPLRAPNPPQLTYCAEWTIHGDGIATCDQYAYIELAKGRNYTSSQNPVTAGEYARTVMVNVGSDVPCGSVHVIEETVTAPSGAGVDFGSSVSSVTRIVTVTVECELTPAFGGCSHGYWKNHAGWPAPYDPDMLLQSVFAIDAAYTGFSGKTFKNALEFGGGPELSAKARLLMVQAVAALLNAAHPDIFYALETPQEVIDAVNAALASHSAATILALQTQLESLNHGSAFCGDVIQ